MPVPVVPVPSTTNDDSRVHAATASSRGGKRAAAVRAERDASSPAPGVGQTS